MEKGNPDINTFTKFLEAGNNTKTIKGMGLALLFDSLDPECEKADITYACPDYETWELTDDLYEKLMNMTGKKLRSFLSGDAWIELNEKIYKGMEEQ